MSRDLTPRELDVFITINKLPNIVDSLIISNNGEAKPAYSNQEKELSHQYKKLGRFGFDLLLCCRDIGILSSDKGKELIQVIEDHFSGQLIQTKELADNVNKWYNGEYSGGCNMRNNDLEFAQYLKHLITSQTTDD